MNHRYTILSESVCCFSLGADISDDNRRLVHAVAWLLRQAPCPWLVDVVPAYNTVTVHTDFGAISERWPQAAVPIRAAADWLQDYLSQQDPTRVSLPPTRTHYLDVHYDGADLPAVAAHLGVSVAEAVAQHAACVHTVYFNGFAPGFAYMGLLPEAWALPRLATPVATLVEPGTVAVANRQTVIYPTPTPRGWHVIGHTTARLFDLRWPEPVLLQAGDTVHFRPF